MRVYLIRHGIREEPQNIEEEESGDPDASLTDEGREVAKSVGDWMVDNDEIPSALIVSPAVRAQETAELVVKQIKDAGLAAPPTRTDVSTGPHMSIRAALMKALADDSLDSVGIVSHHDAIRNGLQQMGDAQAMHIDTMAMGELRVLKMKRKSGKWEEKQRVLPSDLGHLDVYE